MTCRPACPAVRRWVPRSLLYSVFFVYLSSVRSACAEGRHKFGAALAEVKYGKTGKTVGAAEHNQSVSVTERGGLHRHRHHRPRVVHETADAAPDALEDTGLRSLSSLLEAAVELGDNSTPAQLLEAGRADATAVVSYVAEAIDDLVDSSGRTEQPIAPHRQPRHWAKRGHHRRHDTEGGIDPSRREHDAGTLVAHDSAFSVASFVESSSVSVEELSRQNAATALRAFDADPAAAIAGFDDETPIIIDMSLGGSGYDGGGDKSAGDLGAGAGGHDYNGYNHDYYDEELASTGVGDSDYAQNGFGFQEYYYETPAEAHERIEEEEHIEESAQDEKRDDLQSGYDVPDEALGGKLEDARMLEGTVRWVVYFSLFTPVGFLVGWLGCYLYPRRSSTSGMVDDSDDG